MMVVRADFEHDVGDAGRVVAADDMWSRSMTISVWRPLCASRRRSAILGITGIAGEALGIGQALPSVPPSRSSGQAPVGDLVAGGVGVGAGCEGEMAIEEAAGEGDHFRAAGRIEAAALRQAAEGVGAVEGIIEAPQRALAALMA